MRSVFVALLTLAVGCVDTTRGHGSGDPGDPQPMDMPDLAPPGYGAYPAGPYGHQIGQTLGDLTLGGYRLTPQQTDSAQLSWDTNIHLAEFHAPKCNCLVITIGALWCPACQDEQPILTDDVARDPSYCVLGIVQEGRTQQVPATQADVDTWTQTFMQNFTVVQGTTTTDRLLSGFGTTIGLPFSFVVQPKTMKVLDVVQGLDRYMYDNATALCAQ